MDLTTTSIKVGHFLFSCEHPLEKLGADSSVIFPPADDCQQMFLHPVNIRCLLREYGSLEASPDYITAAVVEIVGHTVTEVSRHDPSASSQLSSVSTNSVVLGTVAGDPPSSSIPGPPAAHVRVQHL